MWVMNEPLVVICSQMVWQPSTGLLEEDLNPVLIMFWSLLQPFYKTFIENELWTTSEW